jgi:hypothetical protein
VVKRPSPGPFGIGEGQCGSYRVTDEYVSPIRISSIAAWAVVLPALKQTYLLVVAAVVVPLALEEPGGFVPSVAGLT